MTDFGYLSVVSKLALAVEVEWNEDLELGNTHMACGPRESIGVDHRPAVEVRETSWQ